MYVFLGGAPCTGFCLLCDPCHVCMYVTKIDNNNNNNNNIIIHACVPLETAIAFLSVGMNLLVSILYMGLFSC